MAILTSKINVVINRLGRIVCDTTIPSARLFWSDIYGDIQWGKAWKIANKYCISNKVKEVSFKMLHRTYPVKHVLARFKLNIDYKCDFCGMEKETILHLFFVCIYRRMFWIDIQNFVTKK